MSKIPTVYEGANLETAEACQGNVSCIQKETRKPLDKLQEVESSISVNDQLKRLGIVVQSILSTSYDPDESPEIGCEATFIRAQDAEGYPFVIYLDSKGYVQTEDVLTETTLLQDVSMVDESFLNACYQNCYPTCRGVACFTPHGVTVRMHDRTAIPRDFHHRYTQMDPTSSHVLSVSVPYPILPLSEICVQPEVVSERVSMCLHSIRQAMMERNSKLMRETHGASKTAPDQIRDFFLTTKGKYEGIQGQLEKLRKERLAGEKISCPCTKECTCGMVRKMKKLDNDIAQRERALQEILGMFMAMAHVSQMYDTMIQKMLRIQEIIQVRFQSF